MARRFMGLNAKQQAVFDQIAVGFGNPNASRSMLAAMEAKGLIVSHEVPMYGSGNSPIDRIPMMVSEYAVPLPIHMQWCAWCSEVVAREATA